MAFIYVIDGEKGAGKTSFMSIFATDMARRFPNMALWSNYELRGSRPFTSYRDFLEMALLDSNLVCWDESYTSMDSRNASSNKGQMFLTHIFNLLRKIRTTLLLSAVDMRTLDSRVRDDIDVYIFARIRGSYTFYEFYDFRTDRLLSRTSINREEMKRIMHERRLFKTWRPVVPIELPDKDTYPVFSKKLLANNDKWWELNHPDYYKSFETSSTRIASNYIMAR